jgi:hypothetical protein
MITITISIKEDAKGASTFLTMDKKKATEGELALSEVIWRGVHVVMNKVVDLQHEFSLDHTMVLDDAAGDIARRVESHYNQP